MNSLIEALKERGLRVTPQRAIIFATIEKLEGHITAEDIFAEVQKVNPYISLATIYRTLELLQDLNLITQTNLGRHQTYFALKEHCSHHHLVCQECGRIEEFCDDVLEPVRALLEERYGFKAQTDHMSIFGICKQCRKS
ncbi:MAG: transcriptional repressor [Anaerolineae bacterium]|nr:transcriptional repressor [Anaerolineae bacterium]